MEEFTAGRIAGYFDPTNNPISMLVYDLQASEYVSPSWSNYTFWFDTILGHEYQFEIYGVDGATGTYTLELYEYVDAEDLDEDGFPDGNGIPDYLGKSYMADGLGGTGIYLDNSDAFAGVTVTGTPTRSTWIENNGGDGLFILSNGAVIVSYINSMKNGGMGVSVNTNNRG